MNRWVSCTEKLDGLRTPGRFVRDVEERCRPEDHVADVELGGLSAHGNPQAKAVIRMTEARDVLITSPRVLTPAASFVTVEGAGSNGIVVDGGDLSKAAKPVTIGVGASPSAVKLRKLSAIPH